MLEPFPNVFCRTHRDFSRPHKDLYLEVGVHVNSLGQYFLYRSYRGAILMLWVFFGHRRFHHTPFYVYCLELIKQSAIIMDKHRPCSLFHFTALSFVFNVIYCILFFLRGTFFLFFSLRGFALKVVIIIIYLRGFALKVIIPIYLRGFALKVIIVIYLRGFALKFVIIIIYLRGFALKVVLILPLRLCPLFSFGPL